MEETDPERHGAELARAHGHIEAFQRQLAEPDAADEQHRAEVETVRAVAAQHTQAERERPAVIAAFGRRARKLLAG